MSVTASCMLLQEMFAAADKNGDGMLSYGELTAAMKQTSKEYSHLEEYARYLERQVTWAARLSPDKTCMFPLPANGAGICCTNSFFSSIQD